MKAILAALLLTACSAQLTPVEAPQMEVQPHLPVSAMIYEYCGEIQMVAVANADSVYDIYGKYDVDKNPQLMLSFLVMPHMWVRLQSHEVCGCSS